MKFFCPRCQQAIEAQGEASNVTCPHCALAVDLTLLHTSAGGPQLPLVWDRTGEPIGPYRLEQLLGSGGMGTVYRAKDARSGATVAVKLLYPQLCALPHLVERFRREARALRSLVHRRIVRFIDEGEHQGQHYLVMEHIEGDNLDDYFRKHKIGHKKIIQLAMQICEALQAAHLAEIVHRDLKPANIIVGADGIRVLDFGIAQLSTDERTLTHSDAILGTVNFMSPEQRTRNQPVDARSDLFSLGVILYFLSTGQIPLGAFEPPRHFNRQIPRKLDRLIAKTLQREPGRRYQSAQELMQALERVQRPASVGVLLSAFLVLGIASAAVTYLVLQSSDVVTPAEPAMGNLLGAPEQATVPQINTGLGQQALANTEPPPATPEPKSPQAEKVTPALVVPSDKIPLYSAPRLASKPVGVLTRGEELTQLGTERGKDKKVQLWIQVQRADGTTGYVPSGVFRTREPASPRIATRKGTKGKPAGKVAPKDEAATPQAAQPVQAVEGK